MISQQSNGTAYENICQPFFNNPLNFNTEERLLSDCCTYCTNILQLDNSPWQRCSNLMGYWYSKGQTKLSKIQKDLIHYLHQWYFSKAKPAYLKIKNISNKLKISRRSTIRTITRLVERGILIRLEYWSNKYKRFRSVLLPNVYKTVKEKINYKLSMKILRNTETVTGGSDRFFFKMVKSLRIKNINIYINILYTNILLTNNFLSLHLTSLNEPLPKKLSGVKSTDNCFETRNTNQKGINNMQTKLKPKRLVLKVKGKMSCPPSISETLDLLEKSDYDPSSIPLVAISELLSYLQNKVFKNYGDNNPDINVFDFNSLFKFSMINKNPHVAQYYRKLFKMLIHLVKDDKNFDDFDLIVMTKKIIGYWSQFAKNAKDKTRKYTGHNPNIKTQTGFKIYICILHYMYYTFNYSKESKLSLPTYEALFKNAIKRIFNYAYVLNLPKRVSLDVALIDYNNSDRFLNCLTLDNEKFYDMINISNRVYQEKPEHVKSLENFKYIFIDCFYSKDNSTGKERFNKFKPNFARFLEILISRIEKYSGNGKRVELCSLKLTAETPEDLPVLFYYLEWLKTEIFSEAVFKFDELFSLHNWKSFIINHMRKERGYTNFWKIIDSN